MPPRDPASGPPSATPSATPSAPSRRERLRTLHESTLVRFVAVGAVNTGIDVGLFWLLHDTLGIVLANVVSTAAGMTFSFVVNGLLTFRAERLRLGDAVRFVASTGTVLFLVQPLVIYALLAVLGDDAVLLAKLGAICVVIVLNFCAYRFVVWPRRRTHA
ncbi:MULTISPECIES: GtrA family protein [unclassified Nocardioides]|uniref:GtrA family protein n=1 Tax=unclassified Nocardioides TaxID=2615069 RepID=UPI000703B78A|nr:MULTISPECIES: GtrA family protein [unclassified Nocardioides]KQQ41822.1 hypothetical protein ASF50_13015 [Nocardioides sp. Leaf307]